jgi:NADPH2:quinone reductase
VKALLCTELTGLAGLAVAEVAEPAAGPGQVVVDVHAAGVNFPDLLMISGRYQISPPLPFSPGGEVARVVRATGPGVGGLRVGDRVIAAPGRPRLRHRRNRHDPHPPPVPGEVTSPRRVGLNGYLEINYITGIAPGGYRASGAVAGSNTILWERQDPICASVASG